jgi:hypothetical protein
MLAGASAESIQCCILQATHGLQVHTPMSSDISLFIGTYAAALEVHQPSPVVCSLLSMLTHYFFHTCALCLQASCG